VRARVVVFPEPLKAVVAEEPLRAPGPGEVLVESICSLVSAGTELTAYTGSFPPGSAWARYVRYPFKPGYSSVGRVVEAGSGVESLRVGSVVAAPAPHADRYVWRAEELVEVPSGVSPEEAAFHTLAAGVMHAVRLAGVKLGESVVVVGLGLLGQLAVQFSRLSGAFPVVAVDLSDYRLELAAKSGADVVVNASREDSAKAVSEATGGRMADVVFEVTGDPSVLPQAIKLARRMGRFVVLSSPRGPSTLDFHDEVNSPSRVIIGTHFYSQPEVETPYYPWTWRRSRELFFRMLISGRLSVKHLVSHVFPFAEAPKAYELLHRSRLQCMGVLFDYRV
jgi:2-desacetyl-2-hydroxyethyl bacteriochlorophyllide A dehydrogenase